MTFASDMDADLNSVFFDDFAQSCLLIRASADVEVEPYGFRCVIEAGIDRITSEGYMKNSWEATVKVSDRVTQNDEIQVLDDDGVVVKKYLVGQLAVREGDVLIYPVEKIK